MIDIKKFDFILESLHITPDLVIDNTRLSITGKYGSCVSWKPDELDIKALEFAEKLVTELKDRRSKIFAADIGASFYCPQALRFASLGLQVDAFDLEPAKNEVSAIAKKLSGKLYYHHKNLNQLTNHDLEHTYSLVYSQRCLFFLTFAQARNIIKLFLDKSMNHARFFLSLGNINAPIAEGYPDRDKPLNLRFAKVDNPYAKKVELNAPVCFYHPDEIENQLLAGLPIRIIELMISSSGGNKLIFEKIEV